MPTVATPSAFTFASLQAELLNDPNGLGYAALKQSHNNGALTALMNDLTKNPTQVVWNNQLDVNQLQAALNAAEYDTLTTNKLLQLLNMLQGPGAIDATNANVRAIFTDIFSGKTTTLANFVLAAQRNGSRAEALWGTGFAVSQDNIAQAY